MGSSGPASGRELGVPGRRAPLPRLGGGGRAARPACVAHPRPLGLLVSTPVRASPESRVPPPPSRRSPAPGCGPTSEAARPGALRRSRQIRPPPPRPRPLACPRARLVTKKAPGSPGRGEARPALPATWMSPGVRLRAPRLGRPAGVHHAKRRAGTARPRVLPSEPPGRSRRAARDFPNWFRGIRGPVARGPGGGAPAAGMDAQAHRLPKGRLCGSRRGPERPLGAVRALSCTQKSDPFD